MDATFEELEQEVILRGHNRRTYAAYIVLSSLIAVGMGISVYLLMWSDSLYVQIGNAIFFSFVLMQAGLLGHDLSHRQVFVSQKINNVVGSVVWGLVCGLSKEGWYVKHNAHHSHVNHINLDPDLAIPFTFSPAQKGTSSPFVARFILPQQHILFFVLLPFVYPSVVWESFQHAFKERNAQSVIDVFLVAIHFFIFLSLPFIFLPPLVAFVFLFVTLVCVGFYMGMAFAPNHKGEEIKEMSKKMVWYDQIILTRNLLPSKVSFYVFGGLGYQVEHHLFPATSRFQYPHIQPLVKAYCLRYAIPYHETTWFGSMQEIYYALKMNRK